MVLHQGNQGSVLDANFEKNRIWTDFRFAYVTGRSLEEISVLFDGEEVEQELKRRTERAELENDGMGSPAFDEEKKLGYAGVQHLE